ncbi:hypothetical protein ACHAW5_004512 [Stephanodiscus triporus]|uniref:Uncharacterized protein n=1 Tax=Stephanodiscus triporus TaxID=2934178 RepID=A0ABD3N5C6_9STRA
MAVTTTSFHRHSTASTIVLSRGTPCRVDIMMNSRLKNPLLVDTEEVELHVVEQLAGPELEQVIRKYQFDMPSETQAEKLRRISNQLMLDRVVLFGCGCIVAVNGTIRFLPTACIDGIET